MIYHCYQHTNYKRVTAFQEILVYLLPFRTHHLVRKLKENLRLRIYAQLIIIIEVICSLTDASYNGKLKLCRKYETTYELILAYIFAKIYYGQLSAMHSSYFQVQLSDWLYERHFTAFFVCSFTVVHHIFCFLLILPTFYFFFNNHD